MCDQSLYPLTVLLSELIIHAAIIRLVFPCCASVSDECKAEYNSLMTAARHYQGDKMAAHGTICSARFHALGTIAMP